MGDTGQPREDAAPKLLGQRAFPALEHDDDDRIRLAHVVDRSLEAAERYPGYEGGLVLANDCQSRREHVVGAAEITRVKLESERRQTLRYAAAELAVVERNYRLDQETDPVNLSVIH